MVKNKLAYEVFWSRKALMSQQIISLVQSAKLYLFYSKKQIQFLLLNIEILEVCVQYLGVVQISPTNLHYINLPKEENIVHQAQPCFNAFHKWTILYILDLKRQHKDIGTTWSCREPNRSSIQLQVILVYKLLISNVHGQVKSVPICTCINYF